MSRTPRTSGNPRPRGRALTRLVVLTLVGVGLATPGTVAAADETADLPVASVVLHSDGDYIGGTATRIWRSGAGVVGVNGATHDVVRVHTRGGPSGEAFDLSFSAPTGETLKPGRYERAEGTRAPGVPLIDISGRGRSCSSEAAGRFEILEIANDLSRLWMTFEQHCQGGPAAVFGEIRYGVDEDADASLIARRLEWPVRDVGATGATLPVRVVNTSDRELAVGAPEVSGDEDFTVRGNDCGPTLAPGATCAVYAGFRAGAPGPRVGTLSVPVGDQDRVATLLGTGAGGDTLWHAVSDRGDPVGQGVVRDYGPDDTVVGRTVDNRVEVTVGHSWRATFEAPHGGPLIPGRYDGATRYPFNADNRPGLDVAGDGRACNRLSGSFTILEAVYDEDGDLTAFRARYEQHCDGQAPAMRGEIAWHATPSFAPLFPAGGDGDAPGDIGAEPIEKVSISTDRVAYTFGDVVRLQIAGPDSQFDWAIYAVSDGGARRLLKTGTTDGHGRHEALLRAAAATRLVVVNTTWGGAGVMQSAPLDIRVLAAVTHRVSGRPSNRAGYLVVRSGTGAILESRARPSIDGCMELTVSLRGSTGWRKPVTISCQQIRAGGRLKTRLDGLGRPGQRVRVRSGFYPGTGSPVLFGASDWTYLHFVR